jgi:hypothetical protein
MNITGYSPQISIEAGVERFVAWYLTEYVPLGLGELSAQKPVRRVDRQDTQVGLEESAS